jgi:beta-glucosidase
MGNLDLVYQIGQATATEMLATGIPWNFAPVLAVPQDIRWGRTYESFSEDTDLVTELGVAYLQGLHSLPDEYTPAAGQTYYVLATPKHFLGDGGTEFGTSTESTYLLDQGDMRLGETSVRSLFLSPYRAAVENGAMSIMPSYSSWNGTKMHAQEYWITDVLKGELGFSGFVISDWGAINQIDFNYYTAVVTAINAGVDMNMVPSDYKGFINAMKSAVENGDISMSRIDDAVRRILTVKFLLGLFDHPFADPQLVDTVGSEAHREIARQAVRQSLVLLKNENNILPMDKDVNTIYIAGRAADNIGLQCGGWTITWQGASGDIQPGTTILEGIQEAVSPNTGIHYDAAGNFDGEADVAIAVVGEIPYAEGVGDKADLNLSDKDIEIINKVRAHSKKMVVIILSGRPLIITDQYQDVDAWVAAWLPGSEGQGVADVLFGDYPFSGTLPVSWPRDMDQLPFDFENLPTQGCQSPLFPIGYGLNVSRTSPPDLLDCE